MPDELASICRCHCRSSVALSAFSEEKQTAVPSNTRPLPSSSLSLSLAVTTATLAPAFWNASKIVGARSHLGSFIIISRAGIGIDEIVAANAMHRRRLAGDDRQIVGIGEARHGGKAAPILALGDHAFRDWASSPCCACDFHIGRLAAVAADDDQRRLRPGIGAAVDRRRIFTILRSWTIRLADEASDRLLRPRRHVVDLHFPQHFANRSDIACITVSSI